MIIKEFASHNATPQTLATVRTIRERFSELYLFVAENVKDSRDRAVALTQLRLAGMCTVQAAVTGDPDSQPIDVTVQKS